MNDFPNQQLLPDEDFVFAYYHFIQKTMNDDALTTLFVGTEMETYPIP